MDNYDLWERNEREYEKWLKKRPKCSECREHIQDEKAYHFNGIWICESCMEEHYIDIEE